MGDPITYEESLRHPQRDYDEGNRNLIREAHRRWQTGQYDAVTFQCFNKAEADTVKAFAEQNYPDMVLHVSWMEPKRSAPSPRAAGEGAVSKEPAP